MVTPIVRLSRLICFAVALCARAHAEPASTTIIVAPPSPSGSASLPAAALPGAPAGTLSIGQPGLIMGTPQPPGVSLTPSTAVPGVPGVAQQVIAAKPSVAELSFLIGPNVNPDARGRPSPVIVRIYELRSLAAFNRADFYSLFEREQEHLGAELVTREELPLMPGARPQAITNLRNDTRYLGIVAAFRDIERARWRATTPVFLNQTTRLEVRLDGTEMTLRIY